MSSATVDSQQKETTITLPCIASRDEWLQARLKLLATRHLIPNFARRSPTNYGIRQLTP